VSECVSFTLVIMVAIVTRFCIFHEVRELDRNSVHSDAGAKSEERVENKSYYAKQNNQMMTILYRDLRLSHFCLCKKNAL
jgi:hypothetical protein